MPGGASHDGYPSRDELVVSPGYPSQRRLESGPVAVIECVQEIPCNPCETACPRHAIRVGEPITNLPVLDEDTCTGCGLCVPACPGLAIFRLHLNYRPGLAAVDFPYEYLPLPGVGSEVEAVGRDGQVLCRARVVAVQGGKKTGSTTVVRLAIPAEYAHEVRSMTGGTSVIPDTILCRCEEVTREEILKAIASGAATMDGVKRRTRAGMGLCQGKTCGRLVARELAQALNTSPAMVRPSRPRPPVRPVRVGEWSPDHEG